MTDEATPAISCQWCGALAAQGATHCAACGAALPLNASLDAMVIPGVTDVDPDLAIYRDKPLHIPKGSASQYAATHAIGAAAVDPFGLLALGALAAVAASELSGASAGRAGRQIDVEKVGVPSEPVMDVARRLQEAQARGETPDPPDPRPDAEAPGVV